jgi:hypothetical protein
MSIPNAPPATLSPIAGNIPAELTALPQHVTWKWEWRGEPQGWTKPPISPRNGRYASSTDPNTWSTFDAALQFAQARHSPGVGFVVTRDDPYVGIDLDKCRNSETGEIDGWAQDIIDRFASYAEVSPSGRGVRIIIKTTTGALPNGEKGRRKGPIEIYSSERYFTLTGHRLSATSDIAERTNELAAFCTEVFGDSTTQTRSRPQLGPSHFSDDGIIERARSASNGGKFVRLWAGDTSEYAGDDSAADLALVGILAFWSQDPAQLDRLFRRSGLYRDKWERADYRERTISRALERGEVYEPARRTVTIGRNGTTPHDDEAADLPAHKSVSVAPVRPWPALDDAALYGLAGDVVRTIGPHTEGDPVAVLGSFLAMTGSAVGRGPYAPVGATRHHAGLFVLSVGKTSRGRKGTAQSESERIVRRADQAWGTRIVGGLSSGEGLIQEVRDATYTRNKDGEDIVDDPGASDKRLLIVEEEFSAVLRVAGRDGNTLSEVVRRAWDGRDLRVMTRKSPLCATGAHISMLGHITIEELLRELDATDRANGFANRYLFLCVQRSKLLPHGGQLAEDQVQALANCVEAALNKARLLGEIRRDDEASRMWEAAYPALTQERPGMLGAVTARAEAQVLRLSLIYALLDGSSAIRRPHLEAALALWQYAEDSAAYIFGDAIGDPIADRVLTALRANGATSQSGLSDLFGRHLPAAKLAAALERLLALGKVRTTRVETGGRPSTVWEAIS